MRPVLLTPVVVAMDACAIDTDTLLERHHLCRQAIREDKGTITAKQLNQLLQDASDDCGDPWFCWHTGWNIEAAGHPMFTASIARGDALGTLLTDLCIAASDLASATRMELHVRGNYSRFISHRLYKPEPAPYIDALSAGLIASLMNFYHGEPGALTIELGDPERVPKNVSCRIVRTDNNSCIAFNFPSSLLLARPGTVQDAPITKAALSAPDTLIDFLARSLADHLDDPHLTAANAALRCDSTLIEINTSLGMEGITLSSLINHWRQEKAQRLLTGTDMDIKSIGSAVGYLDATSFSRTFRRWTGMSPTAYRHTKNAESPLQVDGLAAAPGTLCRGQAGKQLL